MGANLFVYGSLAFPSVWNNVVRGRYDSSPARLDGYRRFAIRGQSYPRMTGDGGGQVPGRVNRDLAVADLDRLDRFEGADYRRIEVDVTVPETGERLPAFAYVYLPVDRGEPHDWDPVAFERDALVDFLRQYPPPADPQVRE
jgi:gamma-glutamylcyclotransferase (GGCT)/AIG2-like uncharacterized protein YtfP